MIVPQVDGSVKNPGIQTFILALGNPILSDDAIGWVVADRLMELLPEDKATIMKESGATVDLVRRFAGFDRLAVIDAIQCGSMPVGTVYRYSLEDFQATVRLSSAHDLNFATAFVLARELGYAIPDDIRIYAVEVQELRTFSEHLSPEVARNVNRIADEIMGDLYPT